MVAAGRSTAPADTPVVTEKAGEPIGPTRRTHDTSRPRDPFFAARFLPPPLPRFLVRRDRLLDRITAGSRHPLTLVVGPAGAGKTVLVSQWAAEHAGQDQVVWLAAEPTDTSGTFWPYVLEALRRHHVALPQDLVAPVCETTDHEVLAGLAAALADLPVPVTIVVDQFDAIGARREVAEELHFVLHHAARHLRVVLTTRHDPHLPLHRYRAAGEMSEIRNSDLVFDAPTASALLARHGLDPDPADVQALVQRTEGWAAGLRLCALAMQRSDDPAAFVQQFAADRTTIADYLLTEVLDAQPEASRDLLLRISVLPRVNHGLANELTGRDDAEWILASLERANAFVEPLGTTGWYRLHPLFAEVLRAHLRHRMPAAEPELHRRAAHWLAAHAHTADAAEQAAQAGEWVYAAEVIIRALAIGSLLAGPDARRLRETFAAMPAGLPGTAPALVTAALCLAGGDGDGCATALRRADACLAGEGPTAAGETFCRVFLGPLCTASAGDVLTPGATDGTSTEPACPGPLPSLPVRIPEFRAALLTVLGAGLLTEGRLQRSAAALRLANAASARDAAGATWGLSLERLALVELIHGDMGAAEVHARAAAEAFDRHGPSAGNRTGLSCLVLAAVAAGRQDLVSARAYLETANACSATRYEPAAAMEAAIAGSQVQLASGNTERALAAVRLAAGDGKPGRGAEWITARLAVAESAVHLARRDPAAAVAVLERQPGGGVEREVALARALIAAGQRGRAVEILTRVPLVPPAGAMSRSQARLVRAQTAARRHGGVDAHRRLCLALQQTRPQDIAPLCDGGDDSPLPPARAVTRDLSRRRADIPLAAPPQPMPAVVEPLSEREREVLRQAAQLQSNAEIAAELHVSVNTVKSHLKSVHRKLCVNRRRDAVRRARQLKLV